MKLNQECVRALLLFIEEVSDYSNYIDAKKIELKGFETVDVVYSADKLLEAGYITAERHTYFGGDHIPNIYISAITWKGHQFLDTVRDNTVWSKTKSIVSKFSSVSLSLLADIASKVILGLIDKQLPMS